MLKTNLILAKAYKLLMPVKGGVNTTYQEKSMNKKQSFSELRTILSSLTEREANVIIARFGLNGQEAQTLEQVGHHFNVTRERIRQIEAKALRKLRNKASHLNARAENYLG